MGIASLSCVPAIASLTSQLPQFDSRKMMSVTSLVLLGLTLVGANPAGMNQYAMADSYKAPAPAPTKAYVAPTPAPTKAYEAPATTKAYEAPATTKAYEAPATTKAYI